MIMTEDYFKTILLKAKKEIIIVCIGSDRFIYDSFGPVTGQLLKENLNNIKVYGTVEKPLNGINIKKEYVKIKEKHKNSIIIAIDSALNRDPFEERLVIKNESIKPGLALQKDLGCIGDYSILFRITKKELLEMDRMRLFDVYNNSKCILDFFKEVDKNIESNYIA